MHSALVPSRRERTALLLQALIIGSLAIGQAMAQSDPARAAATSPPPPDVSAAELMASARSEVRIVAQENHQVEEYSVNNNVYKLKVTPKNAPPYYLVDEDGRGLQWKRGPGLERDTVPKWTIFRW